MQPARYRAKPASAMRSSVTLEPPRRLRNMVTDPVRLAALIVANAPANILGPDFDPAEWLADPANFALVDGDDLGMFEAGDEWPGPLTAHVLFASRGKQALTTARAMLDQAFAFGATSILGETPASLSHALLFARMLGFVPYGEAERPMGRVILSALNANPFLLSAVA